MLSASFTGIVILLVAMKFPLRLQQLLKPSAVGADDGDDTIRRIEPQAG